MIETPVWVQLVYLAAAVFFILALFLLRVFLLLQPVLCDLHRLGLDSLDVRLRHRADGGCLLLAKEAVAVASATPRFLISLPRGRAIPCCPPSDCSSH